MATTDAEGVARQLRRAYEGRDLELLAPLLAPDVRWGSDDHPRRCRSRADVLRTFDRALTAGADGELLEVRPGELGVLCRVSVRWPAGDERGDPPEFFHVYVVRDGLIREIRRYDDRPSALAAAGLEAAPG